MKIRNGFVSNSSSSSFICDICGATESGWDFGLDDVEMAECKNGHTFCQSEMNVDLLEKAQNDEDFPYEISSDFCPICQMEYISNSERERYIMKKINMTHKELNEEIKEKFLTYNEFKNYLEKDNEN